MDYRKAHAAFNDYFSRAMDAVQSQYPFWAASEGRDHLFVFPSERGASTLSPENAIRIHKSVFLTGLQRRDPDWAHFSPHKDIVLPPAASLSIFLKGRGGGESGSKIGEIPRSNDGEEMAMVGEETAPGSQSRAVFLHFRSPPSPPTTKQ